VATLVTESKQPRQTLPRASCLEEVVRDELVRCGSRFDVHAQADAKECLEFLGQLLWLLETWGTMSGDQVESLEWLLIEVRWLRFNHFNGHDTERPDVDLAAILFLLDDLRCHPVWCADHGGALVALFGELSAKTEIGWNVVSIRTYYTIIVMYVLILTFPRASRRTLSLLMSR
jgi:hypothetical protein